MANLVIVESPGKVKKVSSILGDGWKVAASVGHVRDLPQNSLGVDAPNYRPSYELTERGREVIAKLRKLVAEADQVYLCTDPDREGEAIAWHLQQTLGLKAPRRAVFRDINPGPVRAGIANPRQIDMDLVAAQEARRVLDRLVGYLVSPRLSALAGSKLTAGRVQTPAVRLVVDRERAIAAFKVTNHFGVRLKFAGGAWSAEWNVKAAFPVAPHFCLDEAVARAAASKRSVTVEAFADSEARRSPPAPLTTSKLQQVASTRLRLKPAAVMEAAQKLYEAGLITYHRTDSPNLAADGFATLKAYAAGAGLETVAEQRTWKAKGNAQEAHEAIRPSHFEDVIAGATEIERSVYKLIRDAALASQMPDARYAVRAATLKAPRAGAPQGFDLYEAKGRTLLAPGWLALGAAGDDDAEEEDKGESANNAVPALQIGDTVTVTAADLVRRKTEPPKRYTEADLVKALETEGIGRPSTYAAIMEKIAGHG